MKRIFRGDLSFSPAGPSCATAPPKATRPTTRSASGWARSRRSTAGCRGGTCSGTRRTSTSRQGFGAFPSPPDLDFIIPCNYFTQIASRVPFDPAATDATAVFQGASLPAPGGLAFGTELYLTSDRFDVAAGVPFHVTAHALSGRSRSTRRRGAGASGRLDGDRQREPRPRDRPHAGDGDLHRHSGRRPRPRAASSSARRSPPTRAPARPTPSSASSRPCRGRCSGCPRWRSSRHWARDAGVPQLGGRVKPVLPIGVGETRSVRVDLHNWSGATQSGKVTLTAPAGFSVTPASQPYSGLAAEAAVSVTFQVTNTNTALPTANEGGGGSGDYDTQVTTTSAGRVEQRDVRPRARALDGRAAGRRAPAVDGVESAGEYGGPALNVSRVWEGDACTSAADCSATAKLAWRGDDLYVVVHVTDDVLGTKVTPADCKRHWRTDSVEITLDPRGTAENTSTTFKTGHLPDDDRRDAVLRAGRRQPPGRRQHRARDAGGVRRAVGALQRLHDRGEDPARGSARGRRPAAPRSERPRLRLRHAGPDRPDAARLVAVRRRPGRPVPLGPRDAAGLHTAGRPADHAVRAGDPSDRRAERRLAAVDPPVGDRRRPARRRAAVAGRRGRSSASRSSRPPR